MFNRLARLMKPKVHLFLFILVSCFCAHYSSAALKAVFVIHRHGDRTPIEPYKNDPYANDTYWIDGWGQLTAKGKKRMYELGQFFRKRYIDFLTNNPREVYIRSSAVERCLESAQLLANGIYSPKGHWVWNSNHNWLPFAIQTEPCKTDGLLYPHSECPAATNEQNRIQQSPDVLRWQTPYKDLFNYLTLNSGQPVNSLFDAWSIYDTLKVQKENNLKLPEWVNDKVMAKLNRISDQSFYYDYSTKIIHRLRAGLLLKELRQHFKDIIEDKNSETGSHSEGAMSAKKLFIYSSHDTLLAALLNALGAFNMLTPPYGASVIFEIHSDNRDVNAEGEHIIKSYYLNESDVVYPLKLSGCSDGEKCKLGEFLYATEELIPYNWKRECGLSQEDNSLSTSGFVYFIIASLSIIAISVVTMLIIYFQRKKKPFVYKLLPVNS